jgi:hypothetical protein
MADDELKPGDEPDAKPQWHWRLIQIISGGLMLWGAYLAAGAAFNSGDRSLKPLLKGLIILVCCAAFVGFWALLLWMRDRKLNEDRSR